MIYPRPNYSLFTEFLRTFGFVALALFTRWAVFDYNSEMPFLTKTWINIVSGVISFCLIEAACSLHDLFIKRRR